MTGGALESLAVPGVESDIGVEGGPEGAALDTPSVSSRSSRVCGLSDGVLPVGGILTLV